MNWPPASVIRSVPDFLTCKALNAIPDNANAITLRTNTGNLRAQKLYRSLGFKIIPNLIQTITKERTYENIPEIDERLFMVLNKNE